MESNSINVAPKAGGFVTSQLSDGVQTTVGFSEVVEIGQIRFLPVASGASFGALDADTTVTISVGSTTLCRGPVRLALLARPSDTGSETATREGPWIVELPAGWIVGPTSQLQLTANGQALDFVTIPR